MSEIGDPVIGQWYLRQDTGETFLVMDYDDASGTVEIQMADGDLDELEEGVWQTLPLDFASPSHDWTEPIDDEAIEQDEDTGRPRAPRRPAGDSRESWEDASPFDEIDGYTDRVVSRDLDG